ncbi:hypothetical protein Tco_0713920 [Tanacetum coccineum]
MGVIRPPLFKLGTNGIVVDDAARQEVIIDVIKLFEQAREAKEDLRKQYAECKDTSQERRALIDKFWDEEGRKDFEIHSNTQNQGHLPGAEYYTGYPERGHKNDEESPSPLTKLIEEFQLLDGISVPSHVGYYDGKGDPDDFIHTFEGATKMEK